MLLFCGPAGDATEGMGNRIREPAAGKAIGVCAVLSYVKDWKSLLVYLAGVLWNGVTMMCVKKLRYFWPACRHFFEDV